MGQLLFLGAQTPAEMLFKTRSHNISLNRLSACVHTWPCSVYRSPCSQRSGIRTTVLLLFGCLCPSSVHFMLLGCYGQVGCLSYNPARISQGYGLFISPSSSLIGSCDFIQFCAWLWFLVGMNSFWTSRTMCLYFCKT